jgi:hypothetical protein
MKPSEILREAARRVERGASIGGCSAIYWAARAPNDYLRNWEARHRAREFFQHLRPTKVPSSGFWWSITNEGDNARIIGLCLAALIAESEGQ